MALVKSFTTSSPCPRRTPPCEDRAVRGFLPWLTVLAVVLLLSALRLRALATVVSIGWLAWCAWTWFRPTRRDPR
jgi:hypothetical protein